jgi:hypothetical protein
VLWQDDEVPTASARGSTMTKKTFTATLGTEEEHTLFFVVPFDVKEVFGKARPPVLVKIGKYSYPSTPAVYGGKWYVPVRREHRAAMGVEAGDVLRVTLELDRSERKVVPPPDLAAALKGNAKAQERWRSSSYSHQKEHVAAILDAKRPETRARRIEKTIQMLTAK